MVIALIVEIPSFLTQIIVRNVGRKLDNFGGYKVPTNARNEDGNGRVVVSLLIRRTKSRIIWGIAVLITGILSILISFITSSSMHYAFIPDGQGGVIPYPVYSTIYPYQFMVFPGLILLVIGIVLIVYSEVRLKRLKRDGDGDVRPDHSTTAIPPMISEDRLSVGVKQPQQTSERPITKYCRFCSGQISIDDDYCGKCGKKLRVGR
jgi:hypothetical protein